MKVIFSILLLCISSTTFAAEFVQQPLFLSKSPVAIGQKVRVFAIISNDGNTAFSGKVFIDENGTLLGSPTASLAVGATQTVSVPWTPSTGGDHAITAQLITDNGTVLQQVSQTFTIALPPVIVAISTATDTSSDLGNLGAGTYQSSAQIQNAIASISPILATDTGSIFGAIDSVRSNFADVLNSQISHANQAVAHINENQKLISTSTDYVVSASPSAVVATSSVPSLAQSKNSAQSWLWNIYLHILLATRFLVDNAALFYPFLVLVFFYIIWKMYRKMSRGY